MSPMKPFAVKHNPRLVLVYRRDHPGSAPYTEVELALLRHMDGLSPQEACSPLDAFMRDRALELYEFVCAWAHQAGIPSASEPTDGIVLASWSMGASWLMALLSSIASLTSRDAPFASLGYLPPSDAYAPLLDEDIPPPDRPSTVLSWISGYYSHDGAVDGLERRTSSTSPTPPLGRMTPEQLQGVFTASAAGEDGPDTLHLRLSEVTGASSLFRHRVLFHNGSHAMRPNHWAALPIRHVACNRSAWHMPWCAAALRRELDEAKDDTRRVRDVEIVTLMGANHFVGCVGFAIRPTALTTRQAHWDEPYRLMHLLHWEGSSSPH
ncbi:hypothetical protein PCL_03235 [Purpureocillium lilacinum]|uniref:Uncharacterized protein n=1 Tax=Purpureocillium lilacinum TaxID=33203 RepID=A0A2U3ENF5_PURLI|nr:hypothetical protein PCL_03235 [Purpureocillium lilacinum]